MAQLFLEYILLGYMAIAVVSHTIVFIAWVHGRMWSSLSYWTVFVGLIVTAMMVNSINTHIFGFAESPVARLTTIVLAWTTYVGMPVIVSAGIVYVFSDTLRDWVRSRLTQ